MNDSAPRKFDLQLTSWLWTQYAEGMALAEESDVLILRPLDIQPGPGVKGQPGVGQPPCAYGATFLCKGIVMAPDGGIQQASRFEVDLQFHADYLRVFSDPGRFRMVATFRRPVNVWHPNINPPVICLGPLPPGTRLVHLLHQVYDIITYRNYGMREDDSVNPLACSWVRENRHLFPTERKTLKRRRSD